VWQGLTALLAEVVVVVLIWWPGPGMRSRFYLAAILTGVPLLAFTLAFLSRSLYQGTLHDANGIPPLRIRVMTKVRELDTNAMAVMAGLAVLVASIFLFQSSS
jgi:hypothetical protein